MDAKDRFRRRLPLLVALLCFVLAAARPSQRSTWIVLGLAFLAAGLRLLKAGRLPPNAPGD
jgi:uncharacterized membrane protein YhhN